MILERKSELTFMMIIWVIRRANVFHLQHVTALVAAFAGMFDGQLINQSISFRLYECRKDWIGDVGDHYRGDGLRRCLQLSSEPCAYLQGCQCSHRTALYLEF